MDKVNESMLDQSVIDRRVIPNGIDTSIFAPGDKLEARNRLDLPRDTRIVMIVANGIKQNTWKDYQTLRGAIDLIGHRQTIGRTLFAAVGERGSEERVGEATLRFFPYEADRNKLADYYRAADIYLHAARADTFPTTVIEALACGTPVVSTATGGIPEQVADGTTGFLVQPNDPGALASKVELLLQDPGKLDDLSVAAAKDAHLRFSEKRMVVEYLDWFEEILSSHRIDAKVTNGRQ
jgi:glycosyltransferase involved in cell wall biosynthesis